MNFEHDGGRMTSRHDLAGSAIRKERIRRRAYELWEEDGRPHGRDQEHWRRAEAEMSVWERRGHVPRSLSSVNENPTTNEKVGSRKARRKGDVLFKTGPDDYRIALNRASAAE